MKSFKPSDLITNNDGSVFHLHLKPGQIARDIILVGDPERVELVSSCFSDIELKVSNREFVTHTGTYNGKRISVISTGIGTDNIDIVVNELDALVNIDLEKRVEKKEKISLNLVRIGTSGSLQAHIKVGSFLLSSKAIGFDGLLNYYSRSEKISDLEFENALISQLPWNDRLATPYVVDASENLISKLSGPETIKGITISAPGFYGPQGRTLRLNPSMKLLNEAITSFSFKKNIITNFEMESSAIYGLGKLLGHEAATVCTIIANRVTEDYISNYKPVIKKLVAYVLDKLTR